MWKKIALGLLALFVALQFIRFDRNTPPIDAQEEFMALTAPPEDVAELLQVACYDCHSHETRYPWYAQVAPVRWWIDDHVAEGREHFNFSVWGTYSPKKADHKLEEAAEEVYDGHMPLKSYPWLHPGARLTDVQRERLMDWFHQQRLALHDELEE